MGFFIKGEGIYVKYCETIRYLEKTFLRRFQHQYSWKTLLSTQDQQPALNANILPSPLCSGIISFSIASRNNPRNALYLQRVLLARNNLDAKFQITKIICCRGEIYTGI